MTNKDSYITNKTDLLLSNFTKLGKYIMISGGSWVFNKKEMGSNDVNMYFRLKSQIPTEEIINCVSFEFTHLGRKNLLKKQHHTMEMETPIMSLFICNWINKGSIISDTKQMLETALDGIKENGMLPKQLYCPNNSKTRTYLILYWNWMHHIFRQRQSEHIIKLMTTIRCRERRRSILKLPKRISASLSSSLAMHIGSSLAPGTLGYLQGSLKPWQIMPQWATAPVSVGVLKGISTTTWAWRASPSMESRY
jgi:hypothetical protein